MRNGDTSDERAEAMAILAHRLRNPLSVLVGYAELLRTRDDERTRLEATTQISDAADEVAFVADDVLALLALELDAVALHPEPVSLGDTTGLALERIRSRTAAYRFVPTPALERWPVVEADPVELPRTLVTVLMAVCSLAPEGGDVELGARVAGRYAELRMSKGGWRLDAAGVEELFERVAPFAAPNEDDVRHTGLELHTARRYVELQGGAARAEALPDGRVDIVLTLPLPLDAA